MGEPANPTKDQITLLQQAARPQIRTKRIAPMPELKESQQSSQQSHISIKLNVKENGVVYFSLEPKPMHSDRGYSYERVMQDEKIR